MRRILIPLALMLSALELCACSRVTARPGETRARVSAQGGAGGGAPSAGSPGFGGGTGFGERPADRIVEPLPASGGPTAAAQPALNQKFGINFVGPNAPWISEQDAAANADFLAGTGVGWAFLPVLWAFTENDPPTDENDGGDRWQGPSGKWHRYDLFGYRAAYARLRERGVRVVVGMYKHPTWAGGNPCYTFDKPECGIIYNDHKAIFSEALGDLASYLAQEFPDADGFSLWNEPDGDNFFSPEPPLRPDLLGEYLNLVHWPAKGAIQARREAMGLPPSRIIGPELATAYDCGTGSAKDRNWGYRTEWLDNFAGPLIKYFPDEIDVFTIHNYSGHSWGPKCQIDRLKSRMNQEGYFRPIWMTEVNIPEMSGTCGPGDRTMADFICEVYKDNDSWWERTFYFTLNGDRCGMSLLDGLTPKPLYDYFKGIVNGSYRCYGR